MSVPGLAQDAGGWTMRFTSAASLPAAVDAVRARGGGRLTAWYTSPTPDVDASAAAAGFSLGRDLLQLRRPLPLPPSVAATSADLETRPFVVGQDEDIWLAVNNRAFASHPEQGGWARADLSAREDEPWFDASGFLLHFVDSDLAGFCWTKVHPGQVGEIYVIGVDPPFVGRGLGLRLTVAGLVYLTGRGCTTGMLYVDASNAPARGLYEKKLDFMLDHVDRSYVCDVR